MLTPQMIEEMNKISGKNVPLTAGSTSSTSGSAPAKSRADEILEIGRRAQEQKVAQSNDSSPKLGQGAAGEFAGNAVRTVGEGLLRTGGLIEQGLDQTAGRVINATQGKGFTPTYTGADAIALAEKSASEHHDTFAGKAGDVVGTVAPYMVGGSEGKAAANLGSKALQVGLNIAKNTAIGTAQTGDVIKGAETGIGGELLGAISTPVKAIAKGAYKALAIPISKGEARMVQAYKAGTPFIDRITKAIGGSVQGPITAADTAFRKGLWGTEGGIGIQAKRAADKLWSEGIKPALEKSKVEINIPKFFSSVEESIIKNTRELSRQKDLIEALHALKADYAGTENVPIGSLQDFKTGWAAKVPQKAYLGKDIAGAFADVRNIAAGKARQAIYEALGPEAKQAYIDHGNLQSLAEWGQTAMTGSKFKGGTGTLLSAAKDALLTPIATIGGHTLYKVGQGMEFIGVPGARYLADLFSEQPQTSQ